MYVSFLKRDVGLDGEIKFSGGLKNAYVKFNKAGHVLVPVRGINISKEMNLESSFDELPGNDSGVVGLLVLNKKMFDIKRIRKQHSSKRKNIITAIATNYIQVSLKPQ